MSLPAASTQPLALEISEDGMQLSLTTGGSSGAVTSVNGQTGAIVVPAEVDGGSAETGIFPVYAIDGGGA